MKYLISGEFQAIRKGEFVTASEADGEFIYDSEASNQNRASVMEVLKATGIKFPPKESTEKLVVKLNDRLSSLSLALVKKMAQTEKVEGIVKAGIEAGKDNDNIMIEVMQSGIGYRAAVKAFEAAMISLGKMIRPGDRVAAIKEALTKAKFDPKGEWDNVAAMISKLSKEVADTDTQQALSGIRKFCKENELECPKKPAAAATGGKTSKEVEEMTHWILENYTAGTDAFDAYCAEKEVSKVRTNTFRHVFKAVGSFTPADSEEAA